MDPEGTTYIRCYKIPTFFQKIHIHSSELWYIKQHHKSRSNTSKFFLSFQKIIQESKNPKIYHVKRRKKTSSLAVALVVHLVSVLLSVLVGADLVSLVEALGLSELVDLGADETGDDLLSGGVVAALACCLEKRCR